MQLRHASVGAAPPDLLVSLNDPRPQETSKGTSETFFGPPQFFTVVRDCKARRCRETETSGRNRAALADARPVFLYLLIFAKS